MRTGQIAVVAVFVVLFVASAQEFRAFKPIPTPKALPKGAKAVEKEKPLKREAVASELKGALGKWNKGEEFAKGLGEEFHDKTRLEDAISTQVPRDAKLNVLSVEGVQLLQQYEQTSPDTGAKELVSVVSVTATTQIEFNDVTRGFRRLKGTNEYILKITGEPEAAPRD